MTGCEFQEEWRSVVPTLFIDLDGTEDPCLVRQWTGAEDCIVLLPGERAVSQLFMLKWGHKLKVSLWN